MLKKYFLFLSLIFCLFTVSACSSNSNQKPAEQVTTDSNEQKEEPEKEEAKSEEPQIETVEKQEITLNLAFGERTGTYTGEMKDGLPNGKGKFEAKNQLGTTWYYEGEFKDGHFNGEGKTIWEAGPTQSGNFQNDIWNPNILQIYEYIDSNIVDNAVNFIETHPDFFPTDNLNKISEFVDESIEYKMIKKEPTAYGDKIIKLQNIRVNQIFATPIDFSTDKKYTYIVGSDGKNIYRLYFIGDMEDIYAEDMINTLYGLPMSARGYDNANGGYTHSIELAVCYYEK